MGTGDLFGELAALVAATRESVNKCLGHFQQRGMIKLDGGRSSSAGQRNCDSRLFILFEARDDGGALHGLAVEDVLHCRVCKVQPELIDVEFPRSGEEMH